MSLAGVPFVYTIQISSDDGVTDREMNITVDELLFIPHYPCLEYTFNIVSVNGAGEGGTSSVSAVLQIGEL